MKIHNIRFGLATNSSSSHSMIFLDDTTGVHDDDCSDNGFGWQFFTASSEESKLNYLALLLRQAMSEVPRNIVNLISKDWVGITPDENGHVDHQSEFAIPCNFGENFPSEEFVRDFREYLLNKNLVILGGNDNTAEDHPLLKQGKLATLPIPTDCGREKIICRKDPEQGFWTLFTPRTGTKVRFSFTGDITPQHAYTPELVDIKITDYCDMGCRFCYQSSTTKGKHSGLSDHQLASCLGEMEVFEVALGGGEPTLHPKFLSMLESFRYYGIVPNFTTKKIDWIRDDEFRGKVLEYAGAFAVSVDGWMDVDNLDALLKVFKIDRDHVNIHIVMGTIQRYNFAHILESCSKAGLRVTLLGYKNVGFGKKQRKIDYDWWLEEVQKHRAVVSVDTCLAAEYEQQILAADINPYMFHTQDGRFSCYIDMVNKQIGPSSYEPEKMVDLDEDNLAESILNKFHSFHNQS